MTEISIVIPVFNEEKNIPELYSELKVVLENLDKSYEIIFIDDGSSDKSSNIIQKIHEKDKHVKLIQFQRNFGKSAALSTGFKHAGGDLIFTMDGDLQDDPNEIPKFLKEIDKGYDLIVGWKVRRRDPLTKRLPSKIFNRLTSLLTGVSIHDFNCCYKVYRKEVAKNIDVYGELHRYIPALAYWRGYSVSEIKVNHRPRRHGKSKYGPMRLVKGFLDLITVKFLMSYAKKPLHFFGIIGLLLTFIGIFIGFYILYVKYILSQPIGDRPLLFASILLIILGIQFFSTGLLGEMITSTGKGSGSEYSIKKILE